MDHEQICARIPHAGRMCLLERVIDWNAESIQCLAVSHHAPDNPLRYGNHLSVLCGVEYAAQAMALHGSLVEQHGAPRAGFLASLRDVNCHTDYLDTVAGPLHIRAQRLSGDGHGFIYEFEVGDGHQVLLSGRSAVRLLKGSL